MRSQPCAPLGKTNNGRREPEFRKARLLGGAQSPEAVPSARRNSLCGCYTEPREGPFGSAQSLRQSSLRCGTRFVGTAEGPYLARKSSNARRE